MKFIINKENLVDNLQKVLGPTTTKQNFPILSSVLISVNDKKIKLTTTDLDTIIIATQEVQAISPGTVAVPMGRFLSIVKELPSSEITVEKVKNNLLITCEKIEFKINILDPEEFPKIEEEKRASLIKLNPETIEEMIKLTSFCVGQEDAKYVLTGLLFEIERDIITIVATDGKRLAYCKRNLPATQPEVQTKISFVLSVRAVHELQKLIKEQQDQIYLFVEENKVGFEWNTIQFVARPIEGEFPQYSQYIPAESKQKLVVDRALFLQAIKRASLLSTPDYQGIKLDIKKDAVTLSKTTPQLGEAKEVIPAHYTGAGIAIGFKPNYLLDVLKNVNDDQISFELYGSDKPAVFRKDNYAYVVASYKI